jgi:hypothetical protein
MSSLNNPMGVPNPVIPMGSGDMAPAAPVTRLGPDGEPEPVGNETQRKVAQEIAARVPKKQETEKPTQAPAAAQPNPTSQPVKKQQ